MSEGPVVGESISNDGSPKLQQLDYDVIQEEQNQVMHTESNAQPSR